MNEMLRIHTIRENVTRWYAQNKRDLPWRHTTDPYRITVSEIMLQQTQVDRVIPKYTAWIKHWPTWRTLARATTGDVLRAWSGLGYNRRALNLKKMAGEVVKHGALPRQRAVLESLPGIGPYTAGAILSFAFRQPVSFVDTNVRRVISRLMFGMKLPNDKQLRSISDHLLPTRRSDLWHHALMDLGATICVARQPKCEQCPLLNECRAYPAIIRTPARKQSPKQKPFLGSDRFWRGRMVAVLVGRGRMTMKKMHQVLRPYGTVDSQRFEHILRQLVNEKMIKQKGKYFTV